MHVRAGFRAVFRQPALALGEIAWRWAFGAAAWVLVALAIRRILARIDITQVELLITRHSDLFLIADACARVIVQVLPQLARESLVLIPAIAVLWIAAATVGRAVTLQALFSTPTLLSTAVVSRPATDVHPHFGRLALLNFFRAIFTLATAIAFFGSMFLAGMAMPAQDLTSGALVGILLATLIAFFWSVVNWFLALAPIWIVREFRPALKSIADSVDLFRRNPGQYTGIASWFGFMRALTFVAAFIAALIASQAMPVASIALCLLIALIYFAIADFLYIARLAAFVALNESSRLSAIRSQPIAPEPLPTSELKADS